MDDLKARIAELEAALLPFAQAYFDLQDQSEGQFGAEQPVIVYDEDVNCTYELNLKDGNEILRLKHLKEAAEVYEGIFIFEGTQHG